MLYWSFMLSKTRIKVTRAKVISIWNKVVIITLINVRI